MNLHGEIAKVAYELYERSGRLKGRDLDNWLDAERIVLTKHASQELEEPEATAMASKGKTKETEKITPAKKTKTGKEDATNVKKEVAKKAVRKVTEKTSPAGR